MPYIVNFTDSNNKSPITVFDNTSSEDTSLRFPGRNVTGYGQIIAENFLHLLENFASTTEPEAPIEGQLWYDSGNGYLQLWDGSNWKAASNIQKSNAEPSVETAKVGELWVDTTNQQLRIFTGTRWILVGPTESSVDGLRYGPAVEKVVDTDNVERSVVIFYVADIAVAIISKDSFTPKSKITGFIAIQSGININNPATVTEQANFVGNLLPKLAGISTFADKLYTGINSQTGEPDGVVASYFLRKDQVNTTEQGINIRSNNGITLGVDGTLIISNSSTAATIYNAASGSSLDLQVNRDGIPNTILRVLDNNIGINKAVPDEALDVVGNIASTGGIIVSDTTPSSNFNNGSIRTAGGAAISKNLLVGTDLVVNGITQTTVVQPSITDTYDMGSASKRWKTVRAKTIVADSIQGVLSGNINGNANTATNLKNVTSFSLTGDVSSPPIEFDGQKGSYTKIFSTTLTANIISSKDEVSSSLGTDYILTYRASAATGAASGLLKQNRNNFVGDLGVPLGTILPYAGKSAPYGYLFCDGSEQEIAKYQDLYDVIGTAYSKTIRLAIQIIKDQAYTIEAIGTTNFTSFGATSSAVGVSFTASRNGTIADGTGAVSTTSYAGVNTFRVPDLRGRFTLGKDNMDNATTVPTVNGSYVDAGGGTAGRVPDIKATILGGDAGQSSVGLSLSNIPDHEHNLTYNGIQYSAVRVDTAINPPASTGLGPTSPGSAQYLNTSGPVKKPDPTFTLGDPIPLMNPYLTVNYIIRSGPPKF